jgi:hypothetical protein
MLYRFLTVAIRVFKRGLLKRGQPNGTQLYISVLAAKVFPYFS